MTTHKDFGTPMSTQQGDRAELTEELQKLQQKIVERQRLEAEWRQDQQMLEVLVAARTVAFMQANEKLQAEIAERRRIESALRASEQRLQLALRVSHIGIWDWDVSTGKVTYSDGVESLFGLTLGTFRDIKEDYFNCIHPDDRSTVTQLVQQTAIAGIGYEVEHRIIKPDATVAWLWSKGDVVREDTGNVVRVVGMLTDITQRKLAEAEVYKDIRKEKEFIERKSRFVSMASHDLRTPLTTILISSDLLKSFYHQLSEEKKLNQLNKIQQAVSQMTQLLDDVLLVSRADSGHSELKPEPLNLEKLCREILEQVRETAGRKINFDFIYTGTCSLVEMDANLVRQIVLNLVSNAVKYSPEKNTVYVNLICEKEQAILEVKDEGIGIPKAEQKRLFEAFYRASNVGNIAGTGLGMAIIKNAVEAHGGSLTFESEVGVGTTFTVYLPTTLRKAN